MKNLIFILIINSLSPSLLATTILSDARLLKELEGKGYTLPQLLSGRVAKSNKTFYQDRIYKSIVDSLKADLNDRQASDRFLSVTMAKKHRLFDYRWLQSQKAHFELVGLVSRFDRAPFTKASGYPCGEVRFLYRLAYNSGAGKYQIYSRLPMTVNLVFWAIDRNGERTDCKSLAKEWLKQKPASFVKQNRALTRFSNLKSVEINLQSVRWPSTVRPDFGGYAEYFLRVFQYDEKKREMKLAPMENMIDVAKLRNSAPLRRKLKAFLSDPQNMKAFDKGIGVIPQEFLATKAMSVAFHGMARLANRPFDQIFDAKEFAIPPSMKTFKTSKAYLRRLNDMSCVGCHQGRAVAGFHFVGVDNPQTHAANAVLMPMSGHLSFDLERRNRYVQALAKGDTPAVERGFSERAENEPGTYGSHCDLGKDPSYGNWKCAKDLKCQSIDTATNNHEIGVCLPETNRFAGDPCDVGRVQQNLNPTKDSVVSKTRRSCRDQQNCFIARDGFPGGLCYDYCRDLKPGETCGKIAFNGFNPCLGRGEPFVKCLEEYTGDLALKACDEENPCRDDFVCAGKAGNDEGACIPPYFLFQLRLDGHPSSL